MVQVKSVLPFSKARISLTSWPWKSSMAAATEYSARISEIKAELKIPFRSDSGSTVSTCKRI